MATFEKVNWIIAVPFSALFIIQIILTFIGGDMESGDGDVDSSIDSDTGIDFQFLTLKNFIAFFTIYGWTGIVCFDMGLGIGISTLISLIAGLIIMVIMASLFYFMGKLTDEGNLNLNNAVGKTCSVYLAIPAKRAGFGKVQVQVQGLQTLNAMTDNEEKIPTGGIVEVLSVINNEILLVKPSSL
jgi:heme/copper-type cytochrome/quinol oxidase subunit 1